MAQLTKAGEWSELDEAAWHEAYQRRGCALSFEEFMWHERRKLNKALIDGTKFDLTLMQEQAEQDESPSRKLGFQSIQAEIGDARQAFHYPARYRLKHSIITEAISFTQTYAGQAWPGEVVEVAGVVEETGSNRRRIVVGSSREAPGEYIKVISNGTLVMGSID